MPGDGIGPEMMGHVKDIFRVAGVPIDFETVKLDSTTDNYDDLYNAIQSVKRNGCAIKGNVEAKIHRPDIKVHGGGNVRILGMVLNGILYPLPSNYLVNLVRSKLLLLVLS